MVRYINVKEAAKMTGYHSVYLTTLLKQGRLPGHKLKPNGKWLIDADELDQFIRKGGNK